MKNTNLLIGKISSGKTLGICLMLLKKVLGMVKTY